jgi:transposase-like protein
MKVVHPEQAWKTGGCPPSAPKPELRMNLHKNARTTPHSRRLMVRRVEQKQPASRVAADFGVNERTVRKWLARWRAGGEPAFNDRSSAPARKTSPELGAQLLDRVQIGAVGRQVADRAARDRRSPGGWCRPGASRWWRTTTSPDARPRHKNCSKWARKRAGDRTLHRERDNDPPVGRRPAMSVRGAPGAARAPATTRQASAIAPRHVDGRAPRS